MITRLIPIFPRNLIIRATIDVKLNCFSLGEVIPNCSSDLKIQSRVRYFFLDLTNQPISLRELGKRTLEQAETREVKATLRTDASL